MAEPIPMLLTCPSCNARHIDADEFATKPHHTHACQSCGMVWRPALVATVGVQFLPGFKDAEAPSGHHHHWVTDDDGVVHPCSCGLSWRAGFEPEGA